MSYGPSTQIPVIVGIDDQSLAEFGQWPWPRYIIARLIQRIGEYEAAGIGLDIIFPEPDRTSVSVICDEMAHEWGMTYSDAARTSPKFENDRVFENALRSTPGVLGYQFKFNGNNAPAENVLHPFKYTIRQQSSAGKCDLPSAADVIYRSRRGISNYRPGTGRFRINDKDGAQQALLRSTSGPAL